MKSGLVSKQIAKYNRRVLLDEDAVSNFDTTNIKVSSLPNIPIPQALPSEPPINVALDEPIKKKTSPPESTKESTWKVLSYLDSNN
jgi:hypothetical protein